MPSSIASTSSMADMVVLYDGQEMTLRQMASKAIRDLQTFLNGIEQDLMAICEIDDLDDDPDKDFRKMIQITDATDDKINGVNMLFERLTGVTRIALGPCPKVTKLWYKAHVAERKATLAAERDRIKAEKDAAKAFNAGLDALNEQKN